MIVADTSALIAMLVHEPEAALFLRTMLSTDVVLVGAPTAFEFTMVAQGERLNSTAVETMHILSRPNMKIAPWTPPLAEIAQSAFLRFGKGRHPAKLNFGDCMSYALAKSLNAPLLYKGEGFAKTDIVSAV